MELLIPAAVLAVFAYVGAPFLYLRLLKWRLRRRSSQAQVIALTFDDGPGTRLTPLVLDRLDREGVQATFFLLGRNVAGRERLIQQILERGHSIGCHSQDHLNHLKIVPWRAVADIKRGWDSVSAATGVDASALPFRPPYGKLNLVSWIYLLVKRTPIAMWTVDGGDTRMEDRNAPGAAARVLEEHGGGVVLLHDFDRSDPRVGQRVLQRVTAILDGCRERFDFGRIDQLLPKGMAK